MLGSDFNIFFSQEELLEITSRKASKGIGLLHLCESFGIVKEEVLAFGNAPNDLDMLRVAGYSAAPSNSFPEVLQEADEVIPPPEEEGVARFLAHNFLLERSNG